MAGRRLRPAPVLMIVHHSGVLVTPPVRLTGPVHPDSPARLFGRRSELRQSSIHAPCLSGEPRAPPCSRSPAAFPATSTRTLGVLFVRYSPFNPPFLLLGNIKLCATPPETTGRKSL